MAMYINHNLMASNAARNLSTIYDRLSTSTQRLSSGLRINSAADDAAGLAIREMMRADIAVLDQGMRNASDAISMIQTAEGALSVIDEKLIRMKELAEQASTGTYTTAQREIMNSEYQAMAAEIDRIANATDFNGIKLLDGSVQWQHQGQGVKIHFGSGNDQAEDYYFIKMGDSRATVETGLQVGGDAKNDIWGTAGTVTSDGTWAGAAGCCAGGIRDPNGELGEYGINSGDVLAYGYNYNLSQSADASLDTPSYIGGMYAVNSSDSLGDLINDVNRGTQSRIEINFTSAGVTNAQLLSGSASAFSVCLGDEAYYWGSSGYVSANLSSYSEKYAVDSATAAPEALANAINSAWTAGTGDYWAYYNSATNDSAVWVFKTEGGDNDDIIGCDQVFESKSAVTAENYVTWRNMETYETFSAGTTFGNGGENWVTAQAQEVSANEWGLTLNGRDVGEEHDIRILNVGSVDDTNADISFTHDMATGNIDGMSRDEFSELQNAAWGDWAGAEIRTQSSAQESLNQIADAIEKKDKIRADLGALQNRLENTMTNISIQSEMLQASESRISDVDVATEMTQFTRNNIMAQAATSMLAQANSLAQLALSLMG